jgi:hypothetical protein
MISLSTVVLPPISPPLVPLSYCCAQHARSSRYGSGNWRQCPQEQANWRCYGLSFSTVLTSISLSCFSLSSLKTSFAAFGGILFGYDTGTISGLQQMPDWLHTFGHPVPVSSTFPDGYGISSTQRSLVVSILSAGTFFGSLNITPLFSALISFRLFRRTSRCSHRRYHWP